jgi:hypothetical protein
MLSDQELQTLVEWFVYEGPFSEMLLKWSKNDERAWYTKITAEMRQKVYDDIANDVESAINLSNVILKLVAFCGEENRKKTVEEWKEIASLDVEKKAYKPYSKNSHWEELEKSPDALLQASQAFLESEFKDSLNRVTACGADVTVACDFMTSCIEPLDDGYQRFMHGMWKGFVDQNRIRKEQDTHKHIAPAAAASSATPVTTHTTRLHQFLQELRALSEY